MVSGQADVAAAGRGADSAPRATQEEGLGAEGQLHPAGQRHGEGAVGADPVQALGVVCGWVGGASGQVRSGKVRMWAVVQNKESTGRTDMFAEKPQVQVEATDETCENNKSNSSSSVLQFSLGGN